MGSKKLFFADFVAHGAPPLEFWSGHRLYALGSQSIKVEKARISYNDDVSS
jgi:hypothetical protein